MFADLAWILPAAVLGAILLALALPSERRRMRFVWGLAAISGALWLTGTLAGADPWVEVAAAALAHLALIHLGAIFVFHLMLRRWEIPRIASDLSIGAGYIAVFLGVLGALGVNVTGLIATSAIATAVLGLAVQDMLANLAGGIVLELERSIVEGDWIRTDQGAGLVRSVRARYVAVHTPDNDTLLIPNSVLVRSPVHLLGREPGETTTPRHRIVVKFALPYRHRAATVVATVEGALRASPMEGVAADPKPHCVVLEFHPEHVQYGVLVWIERPLMELLDASGLRLRIASALDRIGAPLEPVPRVVDLQSSREASPDARAAALDRVEIFQALHPAEREALSASLSRLSFAPGEAILRQGEPGDSLFILASGRVRVLVSRPSGLSEQVAILGPGDFFGEMALLAGETRAATVTAIDAVECYSLGKPELAALLEERPELAAEFARAILDRQSGLHAAQEKLAGEEARQNAAPGGDLLSRIRRYFELSA
ncbi:MAG: mechanosensitive ion channel [Bryobacterales bacterium]|nr:mechanosensitive ion channel [Bryobacterales bacterium]